MRTDEETGEGRRVELPPRLDLAAAGALRDELLKLRGRDVVMDGSGVRHLGGAGLQVLLAARRLWAAEGRSLRLAEPSAALSEGLALMGAHGSAGGTGGVAEWD